MLKIKNFICSLAQNNLLMFFLLVATGSYICSQTKFENGWDFTNYHYYNAFAFLHDRLNYDIVPASLNTFFNPLIELPFYFIIQYFNDQPTIAYALQGIWFGLLLFAFYKCCTLFFEPNNILNIVLCLLTLTIAATGQATWFQAGSSTNEIQLAFVAYTALYFLFKMVKYPENQKPWKYFLLGVLLGAALGLKSTIIFICFGTGFSLILCYKYLHKPLLFIILFATGGLLGFLLTNGWWMYKMWVLYDNPFFPFLNGIFHSPYFDDINFADRRFIPPLLLAPIFPFIWQHEETPTAEIYFDDIHFVVFYSMALLCLFYLLLKPAERFKKLYAHRLWFFYVILMMMLYLFWLIMFSIYRYIVVIEMAAAIFFVKILFSYNPKNNLKFILYYVSAIFLCYLLIENVEHHYFWKGGNRQNKMIDVENIQLPPNTLLKLYSYPTAAFIPILAQNNQFRALGYKHTNAIHMQGSDFADRGKFREIRDKIEAEHTGPVVVIYRDLGVFNISRPILHSAMDKDIYDKYCREIRNNLNELLYICVPQELKNEILTEQENESDRPQ